MKDLQISLLKSGIEFVTMHQTGKSGHCFPVTKERRLNDSVIYNCVFTYTFCKSSLAYLDSLTQTSVTINVVYMSKNYGHLFKFSRS